MITLFIIYIYTPLNDFYVWQITFVS